VSVGRRKRKEKREGEATRPGRTKTSKRAERGKKRNGKVYSLSFLFPQSFRCFENIEGERRERKKKNTDNPIIQKR